MSLIVSPQEDARQRIAKKIEREITQRDPSAVVLGPGLNRTGDISDSAIDHEMQYDISRFPKLEREAGELEDRIRNAKRKTSELLDEAQRQHARTKAESAKYRWVGQERWQGHEQEAARKVNVLSCREFVRKLAGVGVRVWLNNFTKLGRIGVNARIPDPDTGKMESCTVTTLHYPFGYEWSIMRFNEYDVPTEEKFRGWRTALLALIVAGALTEAQAHRAFGAPSNSLASEFYLETLRNYREKTGFFRPSLDTLAQAAIAERAKGAKKRSGRHPQRKKAQRRKKSKRGILGIYPEIS